ncbi:hypothetical protein N7490_012159 [Penicillium lividum]|nr:hypothetical protein N7490_012159 [Penicillium lividum]
MNRMNRQKTTWKFEESLRRLKEIQRIANNQSMIKTGQSPTKLITKYQRHASADIGKDQGKTDRSELMLLNKKCKQ